MEKKTGSLYDLTGEYLELLEVLEDPDVDEESVKKALKGLEGTIISKFDGYMKVYRTLEHKVAALKAESNRLDKKRKTANNSMTRMKELLMQSMIATKRDKVETDLFKAIITDGKGSVVIDDEDEIPDEFLIEQEPKVDKKALMDFLGKHPNQEFEYAHIEPGKQLRFY